MGEYDIFTKFSSMHWEEGLRLIESILGGRWSPMILFAIEEGAERFSDIKAGIEYISDTELQRKLNALIQSGLVIKTNPPIDTRKSEYRLTDFGGEITHTLRHILSISVKHSARTQAT